MIPLYIVLVSGIVLGYVGWFANQFRRDYLTTWKGHRIQVIHRAFNMDVLVDGQTVLSQVKKKSHSISVHFGDNGQCTLFVSPHVDSNGTIDTIQIAVNDEILSVLMAPTNFWGSTIEPNTQLPRLLIDAPRDIEISDSRFPPAKRFYDRLRQHNHPDPNFVPNLDKIFQTLIGRFQRLEELQASLADYEQLGTDIEPLQKMQEQQERDIQSMLQGLQEMHIHIMQIQDASDTEHIQELEDIVARLQVEVEMT